MPLASIVIAQHDRSIAQGLANELQSHFTRVAVTENAMELRTMLLRHEARVAVLDLELVTLDEAQQLASSLGDLTIVCTHHSPDEHMWTAALNAGAAELCHSQDVRSILRASRSRLGHSDCQRTCWGGHESPLQDLVGTGVTSPSFVNLRAFGHGGQFVNKPSSITKC